MENFDPAKTVVSFNIVVGVIASVVGAVVVVAGAYVGLLIKSIKKDISTGDKFAEDKIKILETILNDHKIRDIGSFEEIFKRLREIEIMMSSLCTEREWIKKNIENGKAVDVKPQKQLITKDINNRFQEIMQNDCRVCGKIDCSFEEELDCRKRAIEVWEEMERMIRNGKKT